MHGTGWLGWVEASASGAVCIAPWEHGLAPCPADLRVSCPPILPQPFVRADAAARSHCRRHTLRFLLVYVTFLPFAFW